MIIFCTYVNPDKNEQLPLAKASDIFLKELCIDKKEIIAKQSNNESRDVKLTICVSGLNDLIRVGANHVFNKSKFITNKHFQHKLEEYYNNLNLYVESPQKIGSYYIIKITPYTPYKKNMYPEYKNTQVHYKQE